MNTAAAGCSSSAQPMNDFYNNRSGSEKIRVSVSCRKESSGVVTRKGHSYEAAALRRSPTIHAGDADSAPCGISRLRSDSIADSSSCTAQLPSGRSFGACAQRRLAEPLAVRTDETARQQRPEARERSLSPGQSIGLPAIIGCRRSGAAQARSEEQNRTRVSRQLHQHANPKAGERARKPA